MNEIIMEDKNQDEITPLATFIPTNMFASMGIRFYFEYVKPLQIADQYHIILKSNYNLNINGKKRREIEIDTITLIKVIEQFGLKVRFPCMSKVAHEDHVYNFPIFICNDRKSAEKVQEAMRYLCKIWQQKGDDRLIS